MFRKGSRGEREIAEQLRAHQWTTEVQKRELLERFQAGASLEASDIAWTAVDQLPEIRNAGLALLKRRDGREALDALVPLLRTRSEAVRRAVERFIKEIAGPVLPAFLGELCDARSDMVRLGAAELAKELPPDAAFGIYRKLLQDPNARLRARALQSIGEIDVPSITAMAYELALPMLQDEDEDIRLSALTVLERTPSEALISHTLTLARSGGARAVAAAFNALKKLLPVAQVDHTHEILALLSDGDPAVRRGAIALLGAVPAEILAQRFVSHFSGALVWVRDRVLETLMKNIPAFVSAIIELAQDIHADPAAAKAARELALSMSEPSAIPVWISLMEEPDWWIRQSAMEKLGRHGAGQEPVFRRLIAALKDPQLSLSAVSALGDLGDPRAAGPLLEAFKSSQARPEDQNEILDAMSKLGEKEPRVGPMLGKISSMPDVELAVREKARLLVGKLQGEAARDSLPEIAAVVKTVDLVTTPNPTIVDFLADTVAHGASDFHLATGFVPHRRLHGKLIPLEVPPVPRERATQLIKELLSDDQWQQLEERRNLDTCIKIEGLGRFRANFYSQRSGFDASFRVIPTVIPRLEQIGLPESIWEIVRYSQGLVLVTGPASCGKSTTLAALINRINESMGRHIITVEDPIEFVHPNKESLVTQREVPRHTAGFARALKAALREDPDVIMVGEMRDLETIGLAVSAAETGHLVFGTLNTTTATGTVDRVINAFPAGLQGQIRSMLADSLKAVISQALLPRLTGHGRIACFEILRGTPAVCALIRESKTFQLPSAMQTGQLAGMITMDQALFKLVEEGKIDAEVGMDRALKKDPFEKLLADERVVA